MAELYDQDHEKYLKFRRTQKQMALMVTLAELDHDWCQWEKEYLDSDERWECEDDWR
jgi:hypothetical protein